MILQDAYDAAQQFLDRDIRRTHSREIVVCAVIEHPKAWAFAYNTRDFVDGTDPLASMVGNGPVVVPRDGTPPFLASSASPLTEQLNALGR